MLGLDPWTALLIVFALALVDGLHTLFTKAVMTRSPLQAAGIGATAQIATAVGVIQYTANPWYLIFVYLGSFLGTYVTLKLDKSGEHHHHH